MRGGTVVLPVLSCEVATGCVTGLLGPGGSGKTTLLRSIVGVQHTTAGMVTVLGDPAALPCCMTQAGAGTCSGRRSGS